MLLFQEPKDTTRYTGTIFGYACCETDTIMRNCSIPELNEGDWVFFQGTVVSVTTYLTLFYFSWLKFKSLKTKISAGADEVITSYCMWIYQFIERFSGQLCVHSVLIDTWYDHNNYTNGVLCHLLKPDKGDYSYMVTNFNGFRRPFCYYAIPENYSR